MATGYEVEVKRPGAARGEEMAIAGLGLFKNGSKRLVDPDEAEAFRAWHRSPVVVEAAYAEGDNTLVEQNGPTVLQAFEKSEWIVVEPVKFTRDDKGEWVVADDSAPDDDDAVDDAVVDDSVDPDAVVDDNTNDGGDE